MKCLPREISVALISLGRSLFHQGGTYSSGIAPAAGTGDCPVNYFMEMELRVFKPGGMVLSSAILLGFADSTKTAGK